LLAVGGVLGGSAGLGFISYKLLTDKEHTLKDIEPDEPAAAGGAGGPNKTGWKLVDKLLPKLREVAADTAIPLGLLVAWIGNESGGRLNDTTRLDARRYSQLMPSASKPIGVDHARLSTDSDYSIDAGVKLIWKYMGLITDLNVARMGTSYFWRLVKLAHSMGSGQTKKVVNAAKAAGQAGSWDALENFALDMKINGPQPKKWFPFVDKIYRAGKPFGFGSEQSAPAVVGFNYDESRSGFDNLLDYVDWDNERKRGVDIETLRREQIEGLPQRLAHFAQHAPTQVAMGHGGHGGHHGGHGGHGRRGGRGFGPGWYGGPWFDYGSDYGDLDFDEQDFIDAVARRVKDLDEQEALGGLSLLGAEP